MYINVYTHFLAELFGLFFHGCNVSDNTLLDFSSIEDIFCYGKIWNQAEFLINNTDTKLHRLLRCQFCIFFSIKFDRTTGWFIGTCQNLNKRRFSSPVFPTNGMYLSTLYLEVHAVQGFYARIVFAYILNSQDNVVHLKPPFPLLKDTP